MSRVSFARECINIKYISMYSLSLHQLEKCKSKYHVRASVLADSSSSFTSMVFTLTGVDGVTDPSVTYVSLVTDTGVCVGASLCTGGIDAALNIFTFTGIYICRINNN